MVADKKALVQQQQHRHSRSRRRPQCGSGDSLFAPPWFTPKAEVPSGPDNFGEAFSHGGAMLGDTFQRSVSGLQQRIRAARVTSLETQQRALSLLMGLIQRHLEGTPAQRWYQNVVARCPRPASAAAAQQGLVRGAGSRRESRGFACGVLLFGGLLWLAGAAPWALPATYLLFAAVALPWRLLKFGPSRNAFFLVDFCYCVNLATVALLLCAPANRQLEAAVYALADGPLAAALIVWQSAWVFGSPSHVISVLIHALPGMALLARRLAPVPPSVLAAVGSVSPAVARWAAARSSDARFPPESGLLWTLCAPLAFYVAWQLLYWLLVQVLFRSFILRHKYETSYSCLARRAAKSNNALNRFVRRGSVARRVCAYGLMQLAFTLAAFAFFLAASRSVVALVAWQVLKLAVPINSGAKHYCEKMPRAAVAAAIKQYQAAAEEGYQISVDACTGAMIFSS